MNRKCQQDLHRPTAVLLAPLAHGQRGDKEDHEDWHPPEQRTQVGDVTSKEALDPEKYEKANH